MMFKNAMVFAYSGIEGLDALAYSLNLERFTAIGATAQKAVGFVEPRGPGGQLVETVDGQWFARLRIDTKTVPARALNEAVEVVCAEIKQTIGRHPGKKERRDIRDDKLLELLPRAFPRTTLINMWFRPEEQQLILGTATQSKADDAINALVRAMPAWFSVWPPQTKLSPQAWMAGLITGDYDSGAFDIARAYRLQGVGDDAAKYREYSGVARMKRDAINALLGEQGSQEVQS